MLRVCSSCLRPIVAEVAVRFPCPQCGEEEIWRCRRCRKLSNPYRCSKCAFQGP